MKLLEHLNRHQYLYKLFEIKTISDLDLYLKGYMSLINSDILELKQYNNEIFLYLMRVLEIYSKKLGQIGYNIHWNIIPLYNPYYDQILALEINNTKIMFIGDSDKLSEKDIKLEKDIDTRSMTLVFKNEIIYTFEPEFKYDDFFQYIPNTKDIQNIIDSIISKKYILPLLAETLYEIGFDYKNISNPETLRILDNINNPEYRFQLKHFHKTYQYPEFFIRNLITNKIEEYQYKNGEISHITKIIKIICPDNNIIGIYNIDSTKCEMYPVSYDILDYISKTSFFDEEESIFFIETYPKDIISKLLWMDETKDGWCFTYDKIKKIYFDINSDGYFEQIK